MAVRKRREGLLVKELGDEVAVYDERADRVHQLNPTAALVWRQCDGRSTVADIAQTMATQTNLPADEEIVHLALSQLESAGLLGEGGGRFGGAKISRRVLIKRLGLAGSAALLLPVVNSIVAPTAAMAGSPPVTLPPVIPPLAPSSVPPTMAPGSVPPTMAPGSVPPTMAPRSVPPTMAPGSVPPTMTPP